MATILVADDDPDILRILVRRLTHRGFDVIAASDGREALNAALESLPDIAVLDGVMPVLAGTEVCARLRTDERTASLPVILLTANAGDTDKRDALEAGADAYMVKPFRIEDLDRQLRDLLPEGSAPAPASD